LKHKAAPPEPSSFVEQQVAQAPQAATAFANAESPTDPLLPQSQPAAVPVAADLPLPKRVVARTIERIGYSCGSVVSSTAIEGEPGAYTVTCSSGQTYQASPVHGRYRFRRSRKH
jgi:hypothetical protein